MISLEGVLNKIFEEALKLGASDIHFESAPEGLQVRWRVAGEMCAGPLLGEAIRNNLLAKIAVMARLDGAQELYPQDGAFVLKGTQVRVSMIPTLGGRSAVLRLFRKAGELEQLAGLGMDAAQKKDAEEALRDGAGLFVIAGPTGSGKTTTFYAALRVLDPKKLKIITVEDPVEQRLEGVCQVGVRAELGFAQALRAILRQSPDVIGVGELRDTESVRMALQAALTGHRVVATLHAQSAAGVVARLADLGVERTLLAEVLSGVVAQRLLSARDSCGQSRQRGVFELWRPSAQARALIRKGVSTASLEDALRAEGFCTMAAQAQELACKGELTREAVMGEFVTL